eukprot:scaffold257298_cov18-Tisochrysis_lutea.AAC.2
MKEFPKEMNARAASKIGVTGVGQMRLQILLSKILFLSMTHINSPVVLRNSLQCTSERAHTSCHAILTFALESHLLASASLWMETRNVAALRVAHAAGLLGDTAEQPLSPVHPSPPGLTPPKPCFNDPCGCPKVAGAHNCEKSSAFDSK